MNSWLSTTPVFLVALFASSAGWAQTDATAVTAPTPQKQEVSKKPVAATEPTANLSGPSDVRQREDETAVPKTDRVEVPKLIPAMPLTIYAVLETGMTALGHFTSTGYDREGAEVYNALTIVPLYELLKAQDRSWLRKLNLSAQLSLLLYYNAGSTARREFDISNLQLQVQTPYLYSDRLTGIDVDAYTRLVLPTGRTTGIGGYYNRFYVHWYNRIGLARTFSIGLPGLHAIRPRYGLVLRKYWFVNQVVQARPSQADGDGYVSAMPEAYRVRGVYNPTFGLTNEFRLTTYFTPRLYLDLILMITNTWTHGPSDPSGPLAGTDIEANRRDSFWGVAEVGYDLFDYLSFSLGIANLGPQRSNGRDWVFPFYDNRYVTWYLDITLLL